MADAVSRLRGQQGRQLELPLDVDVTRGSAVGRALKQFTAPFGWTLASTAGMRLGVPLVAATTPLAAQLLHKEWADDFVPNLALGAGLGGAWGAAVGAAIPRTDTGIAVTRLRAAGSGAVKGMMLAPAVALVSKLVSDEVASTLTAPIKDRLDAVKEQRDTALEQAQQP